MRLEVPSPQSRLQTGSALSLHIFPPSHTPLQISGQALCILLLLLLLRLLLVVAVLVVVVVAEVVVLDVFLLSILLLRRL